VTRSRNLGLAEINILGLQIFPAGLRGRIRMAGGELTVRVPVCDLRPLRA
jgi:hypothetical protein